MSRIRISVMVAALVFSGAVARAQDAAEIAQQAMTLQQNGEYGQAADAYRSLLKITPNDVATHVNLGVVLVQLGRFEEALSEYRAADALLPGDPRIQLNVALAYQKSGRLAEAERRFEQLHTANPGNAQVAMLLADALLQSGEDQRVVSLLEPLKDSSDLGVAYMLGIALLRLHREGDAQGYLDKILQNGDTAEARFLLGTRMFEAGDFPGAVKQLASAADLNAKLPGLQALYGRTLLYTGDPDAALRAFRAELEVNPNDFAANLGAAQILTVRKEFKEGRGFARKALALRPDSSEAKLAAAQNLLGGGDYPAAKHLAEDAARALPGSVEAHRTLAAVYRGLHTPVAAQREEQTAESLAVAEDPGPKAGETAPDFELADAAGSRVRLSSFRGKFAVALIFGSYSCPNFRGSAETLKTLQKRYGEHVSFLLVYIREAHATGQWQSTRNVRADVALAPAATMAEKEDHAALCSRTLHLPFRALIDGMDDAVATAYNAWPSRAFIVSKHGRVVYSTRLTELDFHPESMEAALRRAGSPGVIATK